MLLITSVLPVNGTINGDRNFSSGKFGNTLYVGGTGPNNYSKIQDAIDDTNPGDTVFVFDDSSPYYESVLIKKSITLKGENRDTTIIRKGESYYIIAIIANNVNINGFTFASVAHNNIESDYNIIENNIFKESYEGFRLYGNFNIVQNNIITNCHEGIYLYDSSNNKILDNSIFDSKYTHGISLGYSRNNTISRNIISSNNEHGIKILDSYGLHTNTTISNNIIENNMEHGISVESSYNKINGNTILSNGKYGISLYESDSSYSDYNIINENNLLKNNYGIHISSTSSRSCIDNFIYHNNFVNNNNNAYDKDSNKWDDGYPLGGNFWDDYNGIDSDDDGIGDTPYSIPGGSNQDNYPFMELWRGLNQPPNIPTITGNTKGKAGKAYEYIFATNEPNGDAIYFYIDWDDGSNTGWLGPYVSDKMITLSHSWDEQGTYNITAKAKDIFGNESDWGKLKVTMPRERAFHRPLLNILKNHPHMSLILRYLLRFSNCINVLRFVDLKYLKTNTYLVT